MSTYADFLADKIAFDRHYGQPVTDDQINPLLKPHQRRIVQWAVEGGRRAIFAAFGLGKSIMQLETLRLTLANAGGGRAVIVCPLGVRIEFAHDAKMLGIPTRFVRRDAEVDGPGIYVTNYESIRDGRLNPNLFDAVSLDEASVLRSYGSKTYQEFLTLFDQVPYRFVATATPSPNRYKELIHYAGFLGVMDTGQALTRFFQRDSTKANNLTLYPHKEREFWLWLNTWSIFLQSPADIGCPADGYDLPPLDVQWHEVDPDLTDDLPVDRDGQGHLVRGVLLGLKEAAAEKRRSMPARVAELMRIVRAHAAADDGQIILWCNLNDEQTAIERALAAEGLTYSSVHGSLDPDDVEAHLAQWRNGDTYALIGKPVMLGQGMNFQQCWTAIYVGLTFSFNDLIQSIHRIQRFGQTRPCTVHLIHAESEREVVTTVRHKWAQHKELTATMTDVIRKHGLSATSVSDALKRSMGVDRVEASSGDRWLLAHNDCVPETESMAEGSVDLIVTSIPFCYDEITEVLTRRGWMTFDKITDDDLVATVNQDSGVMEWQQPTSRVWERYAGDMIHFTGRSFDHLVTPNHRMWARRPGSGFELVPADAIATQYEARTGAGAIRRGWRTCLVPPNVGAGERPDRIAIPKLPQDERAGHGVELYWIESDDFMRLAGWYLSEGHADLFTSRSGGRISIAQTSANQEFRDEIEAMFLRIGLPPSLHPNMLTVWCRNLAWFLQVEFGHGARQKRIPRWVKDLHPDLLMILRDTMMKGDGAKSLTSYASISGTLRDDFQEICIATGWRATVNGSKVVQVGSTQVDPEIRERPRRVTYDGMIGCLTVPNHTLIVRRNGKPFVSGNSNHYEYTPSYNDFGHTDDNDHFWSQMDYLTPQLLRILAPGRIYACHVKDRINFGAVTGAGVPTVSPFHAEALFHAQRHGFDYLGMITVVTDVVRENNQTYRLGWSEMAKDGTKMGVGSPEYILIFHKPQTDRSKGYADVPVIKDKGEYTRARWQVDAHAFWRSSGNRMLTPDELAALPVEQMQRLFTEQTLRDVYDYESHVRIGEYLDGRGALPATFMSLAPGSWTPDVWHDVDRMRTLNGDQRRRNVQMHVCPLQFDIAERVIRRYSNPGDLVYDPFAGLGTVPLVANRLDRRGRGTELNPGYWADSVKYLEAEERKVSMPSLFDLVVDEQVPA